MNINDYVYGESSSPASGILIAENISPVVVMLEYPPLHSNSGQVYIKFVVKSTDGIILPTAQAYYRKDLNSAYTLLGLNREIDPYAVGEGFNLIDIKAEINGVWTNIFVYEWEVDLQAPEFVGSAPVDGAVDIGVQSQVIIQFSEIVQSNPIFAEDAIEITPTIAGTWSGGGHSYTFTPLSRFEYDTDYAFVITSAIQDLSGNVYAGNDVINFKTASRANIAPEPPNFDGVTNYSKNSDGKPQFVFNIADDEDADALHFIVEVTSDSNYVRRYSSEDYPTSFIYYPTSGSRIASFPVDGVLPSSGKVVFVMPIVLNSGEYSFKVFADDRR